MYYTKSVEMIFDIVCVDYEFDENNIYCHNEPNPKWFIDALLSKENINKLVVEDNDKENYYDMGNEKILVLYNKYGRKSKSLFPIFVSYNPIFGIEFVHANPDSKLKGDWKRLCGIENNPFEGL